MKIHLHKNDLPADIHFGKSVAIDTEAMGLNPLRDRLCVVQLSSGNGECHLVQMLPEAKYKAPQLSQLLEDPHILKIFHYARFDVAILNHYLQVKTGPIYCTKIASKLARTYTDRHGLKDLCAELLDVELNKEAGSSDWGQNQLTKEQEKYAGSDVLYLHRLKEKLDMMLARENRNEVAQKYFDFLPTVAEMDLKEFSTHYLFSHQ